MIWLWIITNHKAFKEATTIEIQFLSLLIASQNILIKESSCSNAPTLRRSPQEHSESTRPLILLVFKRLLHNNNIIIRKKCVHKEFNDQEWQEKNKNIKVMKREKKSGGGVKVIIKTNLCGCEGERVCSIYIITTFRADRLRIHKPTMTGVEVSIRIVATNF